MIVVPSQWPRALPAKIAFVAEAPGDTEVVKGVPLVGQSGKLFNMALHNADISRWDCFVTNVFDFQLPDNEIKRICVPRKESDTELPAACSGGYVPGSIANPALARLKEELERAKPNVIVAMGGVAAWALLGYPGNVALKKIRGTVHEGVLVPFKVIPTYLPTFILRQYQMYPYLWSDLLKARRESAFPEIKKVDYDLIVPETPDRIQDLFERLAPPYAVDIETTRGLIDCIGFSDGYINFTVPIFDDKTFRPFWDRDTELHVRQMVCNVLAGPTPKIFQNGSYDVQRLWEIWHVKTRGYMHDTRLLHHALWPELPNDLASMAALHTELPSWKPVRGKGMKKDE